MKRFSKFLSRWLLILFILGVSLAIFKSAGAQTELIKIDLPTSNSLSGTVTISGTVVTQTSWIGLYLFDPTVSPVLTDALCGLTTFPAYQCQWDTSQVPDGSHTIKAAIKDSAGIISYSTGVTVTISNRSISSPVTPPPEKTITPTPTPTPIPSPSMTKTSQPIAGRPDLSPVPAAAPASTPPLTLSPTVQELIANSQLITTIVYKIDLDKPLHLTKIESRQTPTQQKLLLFSGQSYPESYLKITLQSQPLVMTAKSDSSGNWQYVLEKPLEPGDHQVFIEVNNNGQIVQSGPYPFTVARAQATSDNPLGTSLTLVDPQKEMLRNYLYLAGGVILLALLVMSIILYFRKLKKIRNANPPIKEPSAI